MMPFSSVAIIEKLALVRIAFCKAPVLSNACWRSASVRPPALPVSSGTMESFAVSNMAGLRVKRATEDYPVLCAKRMYASTHKAAVYRFAQARPPDSSVITGSGSPTSCGCDRGNHRVDARLPDSRSCTAPGFCRRVDRACRRAHAVKDWRGGGAVLPL